MSSDSYWKPEGGQAEVHAIFPSGPTYSSSPVRWVPPMDIYETQNEIIAVAELPGVRQEDIRVYLKDGNLIISGAKQKLSGFSGQSYYCLECFYGTFKRSFSINVDIDSDNMDATFENGVLTVIMPKRNKGNSGGAD